MSNRRIAWIAALLIAVAALIVAGTWLEKRRKPWTTGTEGVDDVTPLGYTEGDRSTR